MANRLALAGMALVLGLALTAALFYRQNPVTTGAADYAQTLAATAGGTYVTLRTLNAVLSIGQEVELGGSAVVASATVQPLKVLEPVDDTIERIAGVVFAIMLAAGVLSVAMAPVGAVGAAMVVLAVVSWAVERAWGQGGPYASPARKLAWYGGFLGLGLPLSFLLAATVADSLTAHVWAEHDAILTEIMAQVDTQTGITPTLADQGSWIQAMRETLGEAGRYQALAQTVFERADELIASFIAILSVYVFQLFLLPCLIVGAVYLIVRHFAARA
ncbi:MAG: hypothetical protein AAGA05_07355 [Pseudomonadota bacterium]